MYYRGPGRSVSFDYYRQPHELAAPRHARVPRDPDGDRPLGVAMGQQRDRLHPRGTHPRPRRRVVLDLRDMVRRRVDPGRGGDDVQRRTVGRVGRPVRLRALHPARRRGVRAAAVEPRVHDLRRPVPRSLFDGCRALRDPADRADVGDLGGGAGARIRQCGVACVEHSAGLGDHRRRRRSWCCTRRSAASSRTPGPTSSRASPSSSGSSR